MEERASLLIVDDERGPAESLRMIFKPYYNVFVAGGGPEALEIIQTAPIDVVTLDLRMPVMSGIEVMERIKQYDPDIEVIVITGYSSLETAIRGLRYGAFDYISKPFDVSHISELVRRAVARRRATLRQRRMKEDFLANVSHELRTPLSAIIGYSAILGEELADVVTAEQRTALERIQANSMELLALVENVLLLNALDAGDVTLTVQPFNLGDLVAQTLRRFAQPALEKGLLLRSDLLTDDLAVIGDEEKVERVLWALIDNAIKFTARGVIVITVRRSARPDALDIEVNDTGIGMHGEEATRVLEGLTQLDPSPRRRFGGLGLGLRVAGKLIGLLGGTIQVHSAVDQGARFTITIPTRPTGVRAALVA